MNDTYVFCPFVCVYVGHDDDDDALVYLQKNVDNVLGIIQHELLMADTSGFS